MEVAFYVCIIKYVNKAISLACRIRQESVKMGPEMINLLGIGLGIDQPKKIACDPRQNSSYLISVYR